MCFRDGRLTDVNARNDPAIAQQHRDALRPPDLRARSFERRSTSELLIHLAYGKYNDITTTRFWISTN